MIDCFIRVYAQNELRLGMAIATVARWKLQPEVRIHILQWDKGLPYNWNLPVAQIEWIPDGGPTFATRCQQFIESTAEGQFYISTDDDALIYGQDFVTRGLKTMEENEDLGYLVALDLVDKVEQKPAPGLHYSHALGAPGFTRKGLITEFPDMQNQFWSIEVHRQMKEKGFKQAVDPDLVFVHLGRGYSISSPVWWRGSDAPVSKS